jgi:hypothetical protein
MVMLQNVFENKKRRMVLCLQQNGEHFQHLLQKELKRSSLKNYYYLYLFLSSMNYHVECNDGKVHYSRCSADV